MHTIPWGELAGLGTAVAWAFSSIFFTWGGQRVGAMAVNRARLLGAVVLVGITHLLLFGRAYPLDAGTDRFLWLGLSAVIGLVVGDSLLFQAYLLVGTRIGVLLLSLAPVFSTLLAWLLLGEMLTAQELLGMVSVLGGVGWVVLERRRANGPQEIASHSYATGILFGLGAGFCQALGLVTAKRGLDGGFPALSAVLIRMSTAAAMLWLWAALQGQAGRTVRSLAAERRASLAILSGTFVGPFVGVWLSLVAVQLARVGVASTLMALTPVVSLPLVRWLTGERITWRAILGTLTAMAGVGVMLLE